MKSAIFDSAEEPGSNFGDTVEIAAPGGWESIFTTTNPLNKASGTSEMWMTDFSGTSASAPFVTGVAGLLLYIDDTLTSAQIKEISQTTGDEITEGNLAGQKRIRNPVKDNPPGSSRQQRINKNRACFCRTVSKGLFFAEYLNAEKAVAGAINFDDLVKSRKIRF